MNVENDKLEGLNLALCLSNQGVDVENDKLELSTGGGLCVISGFGLLSRSVNEASVKLELLRKKLT